MEDGLRAAETPSPLDAVARPAPVTGVEVPLLLALVVGPVGAEGVEVAWEVGRVADAGLPPTRLVVRPAPGVGPGRDAAVRPAVRVDRVPRPR